MVINLTVTTMRYLILSVFSVVSVCGLAQHYSITSPGKKISVTVSNTTSLTYRVAYQGKEVIKSSSLGFKLNKPATDLSTFTIVTVDSLTHDETWTPVWGEVNKSETTIKNLPSHFRTNHRINSC